MIWYIESCEYSEIKFIFEIDTNNVIVLIDFSVVHFCASNFCITLKNWKDYTDVQRWCLVSLKLKLNGY